MYRPPPIELLRAARVALGLDQRDLARLTGLSPRTIYRIEKGEARLESVLEVQLALERQGLRFIEETETRGPGFLLQKKGHTRGET